MGRRGREREKLSREEGGGIGGDRGEKTRERVARIR